MNKYLVRLLLLGTVLSVLEILLRIVGYAPWHAATLSTAGLYEHDEVLGWQNMPGVHRFQSLEDPSKVITMTFWPDASRVTGGAEKLSGPDVLFLGCSFTQGFGISDEETFAWKLQERFSKLNIRNFGTGGYGTYQSLLLLKRLLSTSMATPKHVVYGFIVDHEQRNIASAQWLTALASRSSEVTVIPFVDVEQNGRELPGIIRFNDTFHYYPPLALLRIYDEAHITLQARYRTHEMNTITTNLVREMSVVAQTGAASFAVLLFGNDPDESLSSYAMKWRKDGLSVLDCTDRRFGTPEYSIPGDGHPNGLMNSVFADCIERYLKNLVN